MNFFDGCLNFFYFSLHSFVHKKHHTTTIPFFFLPPGPIIHISALLAFWTATLFQHIDDKYINRTHGTRMQSSKNHMGKWYFLVFNCLVASNILEKKNKKEGFSSCAVPFSRSHVLSPLLLFFVCCFLTGKSEQRDFLATGAACGICTAFRAPLAGKFLFWLQLCFCIDHLRF